MSWVTADRICQEKADAEEVAVGAGTGPTGGSGALGVELGDGVEAGREVLGGRVAWAMLGG